MKWLNSRNFRLLKVFISHDLRGRYVGSTLGIFWNFINPLIQLALYTFIFQVIMKQTSDYHPVYAVVIFSGLLPWMAISESLMRCTSSIMENANLVKKVVFPKEILILYIAASGFIHELMGMSIFLLFLIILGTPPKLVAFLIVFVFVVQLIFSIGLGFLLSTLNVFIRDTAPLLQALLPVWFFMTPIVYSADAIPDNLAPYMVLNPLYTLVNMYRSILLLNELPSLRDFGIFGLFAGLVFILGITYFRKNKRIFSDFI